MQQSKDSSENVFKLEFICKNKNVSLLIRLILQMFIRNVIIFHSGYEILLAIRGLMILHIIFSLV